MFKQSKRKAGVLRRAFTITELVIVIAVIAILAAVLIPTFANVIENSKKSHDEQYVHEINVALNNYSISHNGDTPDNYEELMTVLADAGLCDAANPFLLATKLKQENMYLVWYTNANSVIMLEDSSNSQFIMVWNTAGASANAVFVYSRGDLTNSASGYVLCTTGDSRTEGAAEYFYDYYINSDGDISKFLENYVSGDNAKYTESSISGVTSDAGFANAILSSIKNQKAGYVYSETTAQKLLSQSATQTTISAGIKADTVELAKKDPSTVSEEEQAAITAAQTTVQQNVRSTLATLATLANDKDDANVLQKKTVQFVEGGADDALEGITLDMSEVSMASIGTTYRKSYEGKGQDEVNRSSFSTNFQGVTLQGMTIAENTFIASGAEEQTQTDSGYPGGGYAFTYGLFGTINNEGSEPIVISNLTIEDVDVDLNGAVNTVGGAAKYNTFSDMAGVVVGYTQGNVTLDNITVRGAKTENGQGAISGYDGVSALVGRAYGHSQSETAKDRTLTINDCHVYDMDVNGQRRAAGFVSYAGIDINVKITDSSLENVNILSQRSDGNISNMFVGVIGHFAKATSLYVDNVTLTNVTCDMKYRANENDTWTNIDEIMSSNTEVIKTMYIFTYGQNKYLPLICCDRDFVIDTASGQKYDFEFGAQGLTFTDGASNYTLKDVSSLPFGNAGDHILNKLSA